MRIRIEKPRLLFLSFIIMYAISAFQFYERDNSFRKLRSNGIVTTATQTCTPINKLFVKYVFEFEMINGRKFVRITKTVDEGEYVPETNRNIIYLLNDPENYWELYEYENYSIGGSLFFFFGPYGLIGTWVCYGLIRFIVYFRSKKNRKEFIKNVAQHRV